MRYSHGESDSRGVLIALREGLSFQIENEIKDKNGRILENSASQHSRK